MGSIPEYKKMYTCFNEKTALLPKNTFFRMMTQKLP